MSEKPSVINLNELLGIEEEIHENKIDITGSTEIEVSKLIPFRNHPFKLYEGERLNDMVESIKEYGVITPLIVRPMEDGRYEILSGHNRANSAKIAGLTKVPVVIKEGLTDEEAMLIVTETNLIQRSFSELSHSEKARILTERHNAIKEQGKKIDLINEIETLSNTDDLEKGSTIRPMGEKHRSDKKVADSYDLSPRVVSRYLRIDTLNNELKKRLDNEEIPFTSAVDLSFLKQEEQEVIEDILKNNGYKINLKKSSILKTLSQGKNFNYNIACEVLSGKYFEKPKENKKPKFTNKFTKNIVEKYVTEKRDIKEIEELIERLLEDHFLKNKKSR